MSSKHTPIDGFRIIRSTSKRHRLMSGQRPVHLSDNLRLLDAIITRELHHSLARIMRKSALEHDARAAALPRPQRAPFNVGRIDLSKCQLPVITDAEAEAMARRETLMHFGLDPDS